MAACCGLEMTMEKPLLRYGVWGRSSPQGTGSELALHTRCCAARCFCLLGHGRGCGWVYLRHKKHRPCSPAKSGAVTLQCGVTPVCSGKGFLPGGILNSSRGQETPSFPQDKWGSTVPQDQAPTVALPAASLSPRIPDSSSKATPAVRMAGKGSGGSSPACKLRLGNGEGTNWGSSPRPGRPD